MTARPTTALRITALSQKKPTRFRLDPDGAALAALAERLDLLDLRKLSFHGEIRAQGRSDWRLTGHLGATVVQPCAVTLDPVTTRIEEDVERRFTPHMPDAVLDEEGAVEMPEDETLEPLGDAIDPARVMEEALALALPLHPRKPDAALSQTAFAEPGTRPLTDADVKPFAGLADLKAKLEKGGE
ncbi:YceD family protein [Pseudooceanicola aestuarii]|uniref:YceD family protein n=1 Tax=Pseudooceanicola aestuarii TaxID=2697319 RepID=UPI00195462E5|nr:DUF177 domain-containing protein [Pseudooceanicola aestuarii]